MSINDPLGTIYISKLIAFFITATTMSTNVSIFEDKIGNASFFLPVAHRRSYIKWVNLCLNFELLPSLRESKDSKHVSTLKMRFSKICISLCAFISYPRCMKALCSSQELQMKFLQTFHKSEYLVKFLPTIIFLWLWTNVRWSML